MHQENSMNDHNWTQKYLAERNGGRYKIKPEELAEASALLIKSSNPLSHKKKRVGTLKE